MSQRSPFWTQGEAVAKTCNSMQDCTSWGHLPLWNRLLVPAERSRSPVSAPVWGTGALAGMAPRIRDSGGSTIPLMT